MAADAGDEDKPGAPPPSFDPKSWAGGAKKPEARATETPKAAPEPAFDPNTTSFNPKHWSGAKPADAAPPTAKKPAKAAGGGKGLMIGGAAAAVLVLAAGGVWLATRHHEPKAVATKTAANETVAGPAQTPIAAVANVERLSLNISDDAQLAGALTSAGLEPGAAARAAQVAIVRLGAHTGELRLAVSVQRPAHRPADLLSVEVRKADGSGVVVVPDGQSFKADLLASDAKTSTKVVRGEMDANSFYSSAVSAGVTDSLIPDFAAAFAFDFDFQREIKPGDIFEAAFEQTLDGAGEPVGPPRLLYASLETSAKSRALYNFTPPGEAKPGWFDANGRSVVRSLMRTPVEGARITSTFGPRMHPVLGYTRMHKGVDFAVVVGTPVYASGDGVVDFVGPHDGHGNYVRVRHTPHLETAYAHLSAFDCKVGDSVRQGQIVAHSGNTGLSSGPHLHYEVIIDGEQVNPLEYVAGDTGRTLSGAELAAFTKERDRIDAIRREQTR